MKYYKYDEKKDVIYFGMYPQSQVKDEALIETLNKKSGAEFLYPTIHDWVFCNYTGPIIDVELDEGVKTKYRGIVGQREDYEKSKKAPVTWFKFEPIKWKILHKDEKEALLISDLIIDNKPYIIFGEEKVIMDYQGNYTKRKPYKSNYKYSYIRSWLNTDFYKKAFDLNEQRIIKTSLIDNKSKYEIPFKEKKEVSSNLLCENTEDKIFFLSYNEILSYFTNQNSEMIPYERIAKCSEYTWSLNRCKDEHKFAYWLRSPSKDTGAFIIGNEGEILDYVIVGSWISGLGVRPACVIKL